MRTGCRGEIRTQQEAEGGWRKMHNEELLNLYGSPNITRVIKARMMTWVGHKNMHGR